MYKRKKHDDINQEGQKCPKKTDIYKSEIYRSFLKFLAEFG